MAGGVGHAFAHRLPGQAAAGLAGPPIVYETRRRQQEVVAPVGDELPPLGVLERVRQLVRQM